MFRCLDPLSIRIMHLGNTVMFGSFQNTNTGTRHHGNTTSIETEHRQSALSLLTCLIAPISLRIE